MASKLLIFNEVVGKAESVKTAGDAKQTFSKRKAPARPKAVTKNYVVPSDRELSVRVTQAIADLPDAMDSASRAGQIIEPSFESISRRFNEFGVSVESCTCSVEIYRKLS